MMVALTIVVLFIIVILSPSPAMAIIEVGVVLALCGTWVRQAPFLSCGAPQENFTVPGMAPPRAVSAPATTAAAGAYPGAIEVDDHGAAARYGHEDRARGANRRAPAGNAFNAGRVAAPTGDAPCLDDEANDAEIDGDERINYQSLSRNDATRVTAGTMNRRRELDPYFREELDQEEDSRWWGRHEV
jgi:hypothetical protein